MRAITLYRLAHWLFRRHVPLLPGLITRVIYLAYNCYIPAECEIGDGTALGYGGIGVVIHARARIGRECIIGTGVTIGGRSRIPGVPQIGDRVYIGTGAKILGDVRVGSDVVIGGNAVVIRNVEDGCVVAGVPARVIRRGIRMQDYV